MSDPFARVVLASVSPQGIPLVTLHLRYWRGIHSEIMTHRCFSRNARSSRAVPVARMLDEIRTDPFIPRHWGKNQRGMQAAEECNEPVLLNKTFQLNSDLGSAGSVTEAVPCTRENAWLKARDEAVAVAEGFMNAGYHKQVANRLLEPFMWIDTLVSSTNWANFFALRDHKDAEPHFRDLARLAKEAIVKADFQELKPGQWHLPYIQPDDNPKIGLAFPKLLGLRVDGPETLPIYQKVSAARCARISYAPFDGDGSIEKELERYQSLVENQPVHASPVEHQATPDDWLTKANFGQGLWAMPEHHRNFRGWRQFRALLDNETTWDSVLTKNGVAA